jgi:hypothetical protein
MIYMIGQKVRVKSWKELLQTKGVVEIHTDLITDNNNSFIRDMGHYCNTYVTIKDIIRSIYFLNKEYYKIKEDSGKYTWNSWMFEDSLKRMLELIE